VWALQTGGFLIVVASNFTIKVRWNICAMCIYALYKRMFLLSFRSSTGNISVRSQGEAQMWSPCQENIRRGINYFHYTLVYKVKLSRYRHAGAKWERRHSSYSFITSTLDRMSCQRHALAALYPRVKTLAIHWIGIWVGLRAGLDTGARGKILFPFQVTNPGRPVGSQTLYWLSYPILVNKRKIKH
jgi:hypothetical protein